MKFPISTTSIIPQSVPIDYDRTLWQLKHVKTRVLKTYADWRVGATANEKRAYKTTDSVLLTFDDYGSPAQVNRLLQILRANKVRAMFFLQGDWADTNPELVAKIASAGHVIGNHTYSHADLTSLSDDEVEDQITRGLAGPWLRPPRGRYDERVRAIAHRLGRRICYWSIDSDDWQGVPASYIQRKVLAEVEPGAVILLHIHGTHTLAALPSLITSIRDRGLALTSFDEPDWGMST